VLSILHISLRSIPSFFPVVGKSDPLCDDWMTLQELGMPAIAKFIALSGDSLNANKFLNL
jgi:hypothetical protein